MGIIRNKQEILDYIKEHPLESQTEIAKRFNIGVETARKYRKQMGCPHSQRKYIENTKIGPHNTLFLERLKNKKGRFVCSFCGKEFISDISSVGTGLTKSCGCLHKKKSRENTFVDITGQRFGKLVALYPTGESNNNRAIWHCKCDCGNECDAIGHLLRNGHKISCGCSNSKGEIKIEKVLKELNIKYIYQKKFDDFINENKRQYLFDFYLPDYNCCIEYDGEQHFSYNGCGWNNEENFKKTIKRDKIKTKYCEEKNIKLIRIPYTDYSKITKNYLTELIEL